MLVNLWVKDTQSGEIHQIGTDPHDSLELFEGNVHYVNMQSMSGTLGGDYTFVDAPDSDAYISVTPDELMLNRELVHKDLVKKIKTRKRSDNCLNDYIHEYAYKLKKITDLLYDYGAYYDVLPNINKCNSFWYNAGHNITSVTYKGYTMYIDVAGRVTGSLVANENYSFRWDVFSSNQNTKEPIANYGPEVFHSLKTDYDIKTNKENGSLIFESNNWFNAVIIHGESGTRYKDSSFPVGDNIIEALLTYVEDFFKYVDECIAQGVIWAEGAPNWMN